LFNPLKIQSPIAEPSRITPRRRALIIAASLLALFLGALDALVMAAAMPTVVAELGGLHLYSWVYSIYLLSRAVSLPLFGKSADIFRSKTLYLVAIALFVAGSLAAAFAESMEFLIACRAVQGIGAGGSFALVYVVLTDISSPETRAKTLSLGSFIWGLASVLGPSMGAFIVAHFSWRWIFLINVPLGALSMAGVAFCLIETRKKKEGAVIDYAGALSLSITILGLLMVFLVGGQIHDWTSTHVAALGLVAVISGYWFYRIEKRASDPILPLAFFTVRGFSTGNGAVFLSSFTIFALFAYAPLFVQSALGKSAMEVGTAVLALSLGWSVGSLLLGQIVDRIGTRAAAITGAIFLTAGCGLTLTFSTATSLLTCFWVFLFVGIGMGFVALGTILVVQNSLSDLDLGVATASNQFSRTLGGTIGVGVGGGFFSLRFDDELDAILKSVSPPNWPAEVALKVQQSPENLFRPDVQAMLSADMLQKLHEAVAGSVMVVFWLALLVSILCLAVCCLLPKLPATAKTARHPKRS
jgi:EmrB/QacA subfamily drug resistance transporter